MLQHLGEYSAHIILFPYNIKHSGVNIYVVCQLGGLYNEKL